MRYCFISFLIICVVFLHILPKNTVSLTGLYIHNNSIEFIIESEKENNLPSKNGANITLYIYQKNEGLIYRVSTNSQLFQYNNYTKGKKHYLILTVPFCSNYIIENKHIYANTNYEISLRYRHTYLDKNIVINNNQNIPLSKISTCFSNFYTVRMY